MEAATTSRVEKQVIQNERESGDRIIFIAIQIHLAAFSSAQGHQCKVTEIRSNPQAKTNVFLYAAREKIDLLVIVTRTENHYTRSCKSPGCVATQPSVALRGHISVPLINALFLHDSCSLFGNPVVVVNTVEMQEKAVVIVAKAAVAMLILWLLG